MATSNFSGFDDANQAWIWNGNKVTADRYRYELSRQQEVTIKQVNDLITRQAADVAAPAAGFSQQQFGGFLREVIPTLLDQYGQVNATAAIQFYDQSREYWDRTLSKASNGGRDAQRTAAQRFATARTQGAVKAAQGYAAQFADTYDTVSKTDAVVNWAMKVRAKQGHQPGVEAMQNALTREVAAYHRDTVLFNSALDPYVNRVQRVAQATACEFCRLMALGSTNGKVRVSTYAAKFHSHCHCTIQPLFEGEEPVRPDYYDKFEKEYAKASKSGGSAKSILKNWRENGLSVAEPVKVSTPKAPMVVAPAPKLTAQEQKTADTVAKIKSMQAASDAKTSQIVPNYDRNKTIWEQKTTGVVPDKWWWQKVANKEEASLLDIRLAQDIPLEQSGVSLKRLSKADSIEQAAKATNPNYEDASGLYKNNCARVVQAYELRRRGYDVSANARDVIGDTTQGMRAYLGGWANPVTGKNAYEETKNITGNISKNARNHILKTYGEGSRGVVQFRYPKTKAGHVFNWEVQNGEVIWVDAQPNTVGLGVFEQFGGQALKDIQVTRLDNMEPSANVLGYLEGIE